MDYFRFCYPNHRLRGASDASAGEGLGGTGEPGGSSKEMLLQKLEENGVNLKKLLNGLYFIILGIVLTRRSK